MRTFIALELPENVKDELVKIQEKISELNLMQGKFTERENLHLTLKFLGEISDSETEKVEGILKKINFKIFQAEISEIGVFSENFIRIVWIGLKGKELFELQKEIDDKLKDIFDSEERFMAHITIARPKFVKDRKRFIEYLKKIKFNKIKFSCEKISLKESELKPEGPVYKDLFVINLK